MIVAKIGDDAILATDVMWIVDDTIANRGIKIPADQAEEARWQYMMVLLPQLIDNKLVFADAKKTIGAGFTGVEKSVADQFEKSQIKKLIKDEKVADYHELEIKLKVRGVSIENEKQAFLERSVAGQWIRQKVNYDKEVTYDQAVAYYHAHVTDYQFKSQARWEEIMVRFDQFPSKDEAYRNICESGNQVLKGAPLGEVAKVRSQGNSAGEGGLNDWTPQGSLVSNVVDSAIFTLPIGKMSQVLEDERFSHRPRDRA